MTTSIPSSFTAVADHERPTVPGHALPAGMWPPANTLDLVGESGESVAASKVAVYAPPPIVLAPAAPNQAQLAEQIVRMLGGGRSPEEACRVLCEQHGYAWEHARDLVQGVAAQQRVRIARRQAPFLLFLGISTLLGGLALLAMGLMRLRVLGAAPVSPIYFRNMVAALISGTLMVLGAGIGLIEVIGSLRK